MAQKCRVCEHSGRRQMEEMYVGGSSKAEISRKFSVGYDSVDYHMRHHLPAQLVESAKEKELEHTSNILEKLNGMIEEADKVYKKSKREGHHTTALKALSEKRNTYELLSKIQYVIHQEQQASKTGGGVTGCPVSYKHFNSAEKSLLALLLDKAVQGHSRDIIPMDTEVKVSDIIGYSYLVDLSGIMDDNSN